MDNFKKMNIFIILILVCCVSALNRRTISSGVNLSPADNTIGWWNFQIWEDTDDDLATDDLFHQLVIASPITPQGILDTTRDILRMELTIPLIYVEDDDLNPLFGSIKTEIAKIGYTEPYDYETIGNAIQKYTTGSQITNIFQQNMDAKYGDEKLYIRSGPDANNCQTYAADLMSYINDKIFKTKIFYMKYIDE
jgi:hypothetical protein